VVDTGQEVRGTIGKGTSGVDIIFDPSIFDFLIGGLLE